MASRTSVRLILFAGIALGIVQPARTEEKKEKERDALAFADKILEAIQIVQEDYIRDVNQGEMAVWAVRALYAHAKEKVPPSLETRLKNAPRRKAELKTLLADARKALGKRKDSDDLTAVLQGMLQRLDPYSDYTPPDKKLRFSSGDESIPVGIGLMIGNDQLSGRLMVVTPIKDGPAYKAGLRAGDVITTIIREVDDDGKPLPRPEVVSTRGLPINKAIKLIEGEAETKVKLVVLLKGQKKPVTLAIARGRADPDSVLGARRKANDEWDFMLDPRHKIGYIRLSSFQRNSYRVVEAVMKDLVKQGVKGFVLDLRFNPGGLLDTALKITDLYIDDGLIFSIRPRGRAAEETPFKGQHAGSLLDFPMVCLVNGDTAWGSEIVPAALQDHKRASIIGERTQGKCSVQNIRDFEVVDLKTGDLKKAEIKLTTASFHRPNGKNLDRWTGGGKNEWGVTPDRVIPLTAKERGELADHLRCLEIIRRPDQRSKKASAFKDRQLDAALEHLRGRIKTADRKTG